jgi:hypothetical protein
MMTHAAVNAVQHVTYATWRKMMSEPREDDDIALDKDAECSDCGCFIFECVCSEPDRMYGDQD